MATSARTPHTTRAPARSAINRNAAAAAVASTVTPPDWARRRLEIQYLAIDDIVPYEWNPRDNAEAVAAVANSIRLTEGFGMPIVVDADNVIIAGHTRVEAAKVLGLLEVPVVRLDHLSPEAVAAFRIVDNKVAEQARWDFDMLASELGKLRDSGIEFTDYGFSQGELDCMSQIVAEDCLSVTQLTPVAEEATAAHVAAQGTRAPTRTRIVVGEMVQFVDAPVYRSWMNGIRELCNFDEAAINAELRRRLGIPG